MTMQKNKQLLEHRNDNWSIDSIRLILTPSETAKSLYFYAQETGHFKTMYPYYCERENLNSFLIIYTISGRGMLHYKGKAYSLTAGMCFFISCNEYHLYKTERDSTWEILWIHINGRNCLGYYNEFSRNNSPVLMCRDSRIKDTIDEIIKHYQNTDLFTEVTVSHLIDRLLTELLVNTAAYNSESPFLPDYIKQIKQKIEKDFYSPLSLLDFEMLCNRSRFSLSREFKKYTGITISECIITTRVSYAKELLKYTILPISEVSAQCGFNNISYFIRQFKQRTDLTPLEYRKIWKED